MLDFLKQISKENFDAVFFLPGEHKDTLQIESAIYKNPGEKLGGSSMGDSYHVILFKENEQTEELYDVDKFEAVFVDPFEYMSDLIKQKWYGVLAKKTTTSDDFVQKTFDKLKGI